MAVIQDEQGNNKPIKTDTSHVFDVNGNPLHGELFIGETIASEDVEEIDGFAHESDVAEINSNLAELISYSDVAIGNITMGTGGYADIQSYLPTKSGYTLLFVQVMDYGQGKGALSVDVAGRYISGTPSQTWTNVALRYFFIKNFA